MTQLDEVEDSQSTTQTRRDLDQTPNEVLVDNPSGDASAIPFRIRWCPPAKAQAVVHGSVDAVTEQESTTFEAVEGMAVFDSETQSFCVAPRPKDKSGVVYDELSDTDKKNLTHPDSRKWTTC